MCGWKIVMPGYQPGTGKDLVDALEDLKKLIDLLDKISPGSPIANPTVDVDLKKLRDLLEELVSNRQGMDAVNVDMYVTICWEECVDHWWCPRWEEKQKPLLVERPGTGGSTWSPMDRKHRKELMLRTARKVAKKECAGIMGSSGAGKGNGKKD